MATGDMAMHMMCPHCGSSNVIRYGLYDGVQRYYCNVCHRKFKADIPYKPYTRVPYRVRRTVQGGGILYIPPVQYPCTPRKTHFKREDMTSKECNQSMNTLDYSEVLGLVAPWNALIQRPIRQPLQDELLGDYTQQGFSLINIDEHNVGLYIGDGLEEVAIFSRPIMPQQARAVCRRQLSRMGGKHG
jgi:ribosomal protein L37AE/L43A